jgi:hypothetical protein
MKLTRISLFTLSLIVVFGFTSDNIPPTNAKVIEYVKSVMGKKVGKGECWDLASEALNYANAKWTPPFGFGKPVDRTKAALMPGDIIQISNVTMESKTETSITRWKMVQHTAVVYEVKSNNELVIAEQNVNNVRKVISNTWNLNDMKSGKMEFFRPQAK